MLSHALNRSVGDEAFFHQTRCSDLQADDRGQGTSLHGRFGRERRIQIANLLAGEWTFHFWHEQAGDLINRLRTASACVRIGSLDASNAGVLDGRPQFVLPNAQHPPSPFAKNAIHVPISRLVPGQLVGPKTPVGSWDTSVEGTTMPETAIYKDRQTLLRKDEIRTPRQLLVAAPTGDRMFAENGDQPQFRRSVSRAANA